MASSLHQWESDPLFSAAEVVQDSADRMESIFRLLLHEQSAVHDGPTNFNLLVSTEYHRRNLATILGTTKWQLEDFEKAVNELATTDKYHAKEDVVSRHKQFIRAIREQINHVEESLEDPSVRTSIRNTQWTDLNEQDRDGLALFLSGGYSRGHTVPSGSEDSSILRRFLDSTTASSSKDVEIFELESRETENSNVNGASLVNHYHLNGPTNSGSWDLESNEVKPKSFCDKSDSGDNKLRSHCSKNNIFQVLNNLWTAYGGRVQRNYTKRLKDGDEQRHFPLHVDAVGAAQHMGGSLFQGSRSSFLAHLLNHFGWLGPCMARYHSRQYRVPVNRRAVQFLLTTIFSLVILGILVSQVA